MWKKSVKPKSTAFKKCQLRTVRGELPQKFEGRLFRNGPGVLARGEQTVPHWFAGNGAILQIEFVDGKCRAQYCHTPTIRYLEEEKTNTIPKFNPFGLLKKIVTGDQQLDQTNPANTSVLPLPNSNIVYAICEGGSPFRLAKDTLDSQGFDQLGYLQSAYSAHPKIDPETHDIYNFGFSPDMTRIVIYRSSADLKALKATGQFPLRDMQSIHDCVLAGRYLVIFEYPLTVDKKWLLLGYSFLECVQWAPEKYNTLIHIFDKDTLKKVTQLEAPPLFNYHFSNGYCNGEEEIVLQYCAYPTDRVQDLFNDLARVPKLAVDPKTEFKCAIIGYFEEMKIDLPSKKITTDRNMNYAVEFPVVSDRLVGKNWRYTHAVISEDPKNPNSFFNGVCRYDRQTKTAEVRKFGIENSLTEPVLVENETGDYLLTIVYHSDINKSMVHLLDAVGLQDIYVAELPEVIPPSYHGRWDYDRVVS